MAPAQVVGAERSIPNKQVDAVEQRPAQTTPVARQIGFAAPAALLLARVPARARVGRGIEHESSRIHRRVARPHDRHPAILERLAQSLQRGRANSESSSKNRTPLWASTTSPTQPRRAPPISPAVVIEWCGARRVARTAVRGPAEPAGHAVDAHHFDRLRAAQRRQDRRQALSQHRLACPRGPAQQAVVATGGRDHQRFHRLALAAHVAQIEAPPLGVPRRPRFAAAAADRARRRREPARRSQTLDDTDAQVLHEHRLACAGRAPARASRMPAFVVASATASVP